MYIHKDSNELVIGVLLFKYNMLKSESKNWQFISLIKSYKPAPLTV